MPDEPVWDFIRKHCLENPICSAMMYALKTHPCRRDEILAQGFKALFDSNEMLMVGLLKCKERHIDPIIVNGKTFIFDPDRSG